MRYVPHTEADRAFMLDAVGVGSVDELFGDIPENVRLQRALNLPASLAEPDLWRHARELAERNRPTERATSLLGAGAYAHYVPHAVDHLLLRGELYTAYTPYQPEISQGTLQIIFEFQTFISELLAMEVANASMYDGATAVAEAALMAARVTRRKRVLVSGAIHPDYLSVVRLSLEATGIQLDVLPTTDAGTTDLAAAAAALSDGEGPVAGLVVGYPNFFGALDDVPAAAELAHDAGALLIATFHEAAAFGLLEPPGALGADIVAGEGQSLGLGVQFGGPHLGLFATRERYLRQMPGRLAGETVDTRGERGFVLTMATREQHIRRERATSNICTNVALMATAASIYMTLLGPRGFQAIARASHLRAEQLKAALGGLEGFGLRYPSPTFNEFVLTTPRPAQALVDELSAQGIAAGVPLSRFWPERDHELLVAATEQTRQAQIDEVVAALKG